MGCGTSKDIPHLISYQREFLGACWNSPYDQESSTYIRSRWMGVSTTTMALHAGNRCFALRNCIMRETLVDSPSPAARDRMADSRSVSLNASFAHGLVMGPGGPRWTTNTPQAYMTPTGTAPLSLVGRGSSRGSLGVDGGRSPGEGGGGPGSPGMTIESLVLDTNKLERNFYNRHLFLQLNGLSVQAGVVFRCAPARRRYHQLSFASVVDVDPIAQEDLENNCGAVSPADSPFQHTSAGLTDYSAVDPSFANLGMSFCSAPSGVEHYADDPFRINPLNPHHNYPIVDKDVLAVRATTPPVIIGSVSVIELQRLPPNAEICFGGWLYLSLEDEQRRLRKTLAAFEARLEAYERRRQHRRRSGSVSSKHASAATASDATRGRAAATPLVSSSGSGTWAAPPPKRTQSTLQPPSKRPTLLAPMEPRRRSSFSYGIGEGGGGDAVRREPFPYQDLFSDPDVILPYAYLIVALPMYECGIAPTTYHASTNHSKPVSLNLDSHRSRESFGVGCITSVRYGGVMIIECREKMGPWDLAWLRRLTDLGKQAAGAEDASSPLGRKNGLSGNFISPESLLAPDELERFRAAGHNAQRHRAELLHQLKSKMRRRLVRSGMHVVMASTRVAARRRRLLRRAASPGASFGNDGRPGPDSNSDDSENEMDQAESSGNSEEESDDLAAPLLRGGRVMQKHGRLLHVLPKDQTEVRGTFRQIGGVRYFHAESLMKGCTSVEVVLGVQQWAVHLLAKPSKARPLCLYLQRYEGIGHALRLANSQVYSGLQTVDPPLSAGSFAMMSNNNHGGPTPVPLSAMHGGGLGVSRQVSTMDLMGGDTGMFPWAAANTAAEYDARAVGGALPSATMGGSFAGPVMAPQRPPSTVGNMSFDSKLGIARVFGGRGGVSMELGFHTLYTGPLDPIVAPVFTPEVEAMIHRLGATNNTARTPRRGRSSMEVVSEASGNTRGYAPSSAYSPGHSRMPTRQPTVIGTERGGGGSACSPLSPEYLRLETELRDLRSELDEVQFLVSNAQQELRQRIEEFVQLATAFLPHTRADQMGPKLLHVKMLRQHPEDCPMKELHADWLPLLMLLFTCPRSQLLCLEQPAAVEPGSELNSSYLFAGLHHLVSALDVCNANRRREMDLEPNTKYTIESFPRLVAPRRLRDLVVAPSPKHRATSRLVEVAGVEGCISYYFTGGSLGVLAGAIRYLADHIRRNYEHEMQRSTGGQALKGGERVGLACRCSAEVLERDQNVFLQRLWLWGATEGTKKGRDLWAKQQRQRHEEAENGEQPTHHIAPEVLAEDVVVGVRFAPTEAFAIFDAIAAYLNVFVEVELDFARRRRAAEEEAAAAAAAASSPISSPPLRRRHSVLAPLSRLKFAGERKGRNESSDDEEDPRRRGNSREPFAEDDEAAALDREGLIVTRFDLCVASNYYYKQHYLQREPIIEANTLSGPSRRGSVVSRQPPPPAAAARRARSQEPSSGNWRKMEVPYTGGEEVRRPRAEKSFNRFYRFLKDNFRAWKVARSNDPAVVAASRFMSVSKA